MEEIGYYTPYKGQMFLYETQLWISDEMLSIIINDLSENNFTTMPQVDESESREIRKFDAPFNRNKRFPMTGKYARVGFDTVWYKLFKKMCFYDKKLFVNNDDIRMAVELVNDLMINFENEIDMLDRESFEHRMQIKWNNGPNGQCNVNGDTDGYYTPYCGRIFLHEKQIWLSQKMLAKIINDIMEDKYNTIPNLGMRSSKKNVLRFDAPFHQTKRFPSILKYAKLSPGSVWFEIFTNIVKKDEKKNLEMIAKFENEVDLINRELFESTMKIRWQNDSDEKKKITNGQIIQTNYKVNDVD